MARYYFRVQLQYDTMDCGPACLSMLSSIYGKKYSLQFIRENCSITSEGVSLLGITEAAKKIGFKTISAKLTINNLKESKETLPAILHWNQNHFVVLYKIKNNKFYIADPAHGLVKLNEERFKKSWLSEEDKGVTLF